MTTATATDRGKSRPPDDRAGSCSSSSASSSGHRITKDGNEKDMITRYVFLRCDPIIHQLQVLLQNYKILPSLVASPSVSLYCTTGSSTNHHTTMITLLGDISERLLILYERIWSLVTSPVMVSGKSPNTNRNNSTSFTVAEDPQAESLLQMKREAVSIMVDYIMLPVISVLRIIGNEQNMWRNKNHPPQRMDDTNEYHTGPEQRHHQILQSMVWKCVIHSCSILSLLVETCHHLEQHQDHTVAVTTEKKKKLVSYLHACIGAIPTGPMIQQRWFHIGDAVTRSTATSNNSNNHIVKNGTGQNNDNVTQKSLEMVVESKLDNGDTCLSRLLSTMQLLIHSLTTAPLTVTSDSCRNNPLNDQYHNIPYLCMVRILDTCITLIEPPPYGTTSHDSTNHTTTAFDPISVELQLIASKIIHSLLILPNHSSQHVPISTDDCTFTWPSVFPAIYSGAYRRIIRSFRQPSNIGRTKNKTTTTISQNITWHCITIITNLIQVCCSKYQKHRRDDETSHHSVTILNRLQALVITANSNKINNKMSTPSTSEMRNEKTKSSPWEDQFFKQVQQHIPSTLNILVSSFGGVRSIPKTRLQMVQMCRTILVDTFHFWLTEQGQRLLLSSLELMLTFVHDVDANVATDAKIFVTEYMTTYLHSKNTDTDRHISEHFEYSHIMKCMIGPRILALIERLPSCVQSGRDSELQASLQYILGYLQYVPKPYLRSALASESIVQTIRRTFTNIFDVPFELSDPYQRGTIVLNFINHGGGCDPTHGVRTSREPFQQRQYISESMIELTKVVVETYGSVIGPKQSMMLIDECVADLYRSCLDRIERNVSMTGHSQIQWIHEWIGTITFIQSIMHGSFHSSVDVENGTSKSRAKTKYLIPLLQSILPIMTTYPLWDLANQWSATKENETSRSEDHFGISAFRGNVVMMCSLLEFIKSSIELLDHETIQSFNMILLYPVLDKMSEQYPGSIRESAYHTIATLASSNGHDVISLIVLNIESCLIGPMLSRLRIPGGRSLQPDTPIDYDIICVLHCATTVLRLATEALATTTPVESITISTAPNILTSMEELTMQLTQRFDSASTIMTFDVLTCLRYLQLFDAVIGLLEVVYRQQSNLDETNTSESTKSPRLSVSPSSVVDLDSEPWFQLLTPYMKTTDDDKLSPKEGFEKYWKEKDGLIRPQNAVGHPNVVIQAQGVNCQRDIQFCSYVVWRLGYLSSHPSLQVQHHTCDVMIKCFQWLGFLGTSDMSSSRVTVSNDDGEPSSSSKTTKNAVFRQVHSSWPTISTRMKSLCTAIVTESDVAHKRPLSLFVLETAAAPSSGPSQRRNSQQISGVGEQRTYLSKIIQLITVMMEHTDDFMFSRFRDDIYPNCIVKLLQYYSKDTTTVPSIPSASRSLPRQKRVYFTESDEELLYTVLDCIRRLYMKQSIGQILSTGHFTPTLGQYVMAIVFYRNSKNVTFPMKSNERIRNIGLDALRQMIHYDTDALYRPLLQLSLLSFQSKHGPESSNNMIPHCPLISGKHHTSTGNHDEDRMDMKVNGDFLSSVHGNVNDTMGTTSSSSSSQVRNNPRIIMDDSTTRGNPSFVVEDEWVLEVTKELMDMIHTLPEQPIYS